MVDVNFHKMICETDEREKSSQHKIFNNILFHSHLILSS